MTTLSKVPGLEHRAEQKLLWISGVATFALALFGISFGLLTGSGAIVFDGIYALIDTMIAVVTIMVARLIGTSTSGDARQGRLVRHFTMGFWHLEPMVLALSGMLLIGSASYALVTAIGSLLSGGRDLEFGTAILYAVVSLALSGGMALLVWRRNRTLQSGLLALDTTAWIISTALTTALLVAFTIGWAVQGTPWEWISPYLDPAVLALVCLCVLPMPFPTLRRALSDILLVTPPDLKAHVDGVAARTVASEGFRSFRAYVARVGRGTQIELYFVVPRGEPARRLEEWDRLRDRIGEEIGGESPHRWLTIAFTTDEEWAE